MVEILQYLGWLVFAGFKFLFAPSTMIIAGYSWWQVILITTVGAWITVLVFYFGAEFTTALFDKWRRKPKKLFKRSSRRLVRVKSKYGLAGLVFIGAFISVPLTAIVAAKYFNKPKQDIPALFLGYFLWATILTGFSTLSLWLGSK